MKEPDGYDPELDFTAEADTLLLVGRLLLTIDLDAIVATVERTHALGPTLDPTKYRDALERGDMDKVRDLAAKLKPAQDFARERLVVGLEVVR